MFNLPIVHIPSDKMSHTLGFVIFSLRVPMLRLNILAALCPAAKASLGNSQEKVNTISICEVFCHSVKRFQILLSWTQEEPGRSVKRQQDETLGN